METSTTAQIASWLLGKLPKETKLCPYCYMVLEDTVDNDALYCPNEMCLNETEYLLE